MHDFPLSPYITNVSSPNLQGNLRLYTNDFSLTEHSSAVLMLSPFGDTSALLGKYSFGDGEVMSFVMLERARSCSSLL